MSYSDEPIILKDRGGSKMKLWLGAGFLLVFIGLLASVAFYPRFVDYRRAHAPRGPMDGNIYTIRMEGERFTMEMARGESQDYHMSFHLQPVRPETVWIPFEHEIFFRLENTGAEFERIGWNPEINGFGLSHYQYNPMHDYIMEIRIERNGREVWSGTRWSFRQFAGGHGHAH